MPELSDSEKQSLKEIIDKLAKTSGSSNSLENPNSRFRPITDWCKHKALFFDDSGAFVGKSKKIKFRKKYFTYKGENYNFLPEKASYFKLTYWFSTTKFYIYKLHDPMPVLLNKENLPLLDATDYKTILDSDLIKKLNPKTDGFLNWLLQPKVLIIGLILIAIIWWFGSGHTASQLSNYVVSQTKPPTEETAVYTPRLVNQTILSNMRR